MKKLICILMTALLLMGLSIAFAEENEASVLTLAELNAWADAYKERALASRPMNDPTEAAALSEDGYCFIYDFATIYADRSEMTAETVIYSIVINDAEQECLRGIRVDQVFTDLLTAFYDENSDLNGDRNFAVLYLIDNNPDQAAWAWVHRDGQRVQEIQYAVQEKRAEGRGYTDAGLIYTIQDNYIAAIRAYGLNSNVEEDAIRAALEEVSDAAKAQGYTQVPFSTDGSALSVFDAEDMNFSGLSFTSFMPDDAEALLGTLTEDIWMEDDTGEWVRTMEFPYCSVSFIYNKKKADPHVSMLTIDVEGFDGPRGIQVGDSLGSVLNRFRNGEGAFEDGREILYGTVGEGAYGFAEYGDDASALLYYAYTDADGRTAVLEIFFDMLSVTEVDVFFAE